MNRKKGGGDQDYSLLTKLKIDLEKRNSIGGT